MTTTATNTTAARLTCAQYTSEIKLIREYYPTTPARTLARMIHSETVTSSMEDGLDIFPAAVSAWRLGKPTFASVYNRLRRVDGSIK